MRVFFDQNPISQVSDTNIIVIVNNYNCCLGLKRVIGFLYVCMHVCMALSHTLMLYVTRNEFFAIVFAAG